MTTEPDGAPEFRLTIADASDLLARFDREMRRSPPPEPNIEVEETGGVVRRRGPRGGTILFTASSSPTVVEEQTAFFRPLGLEVEWKVYGHDRTAPPPALLAAAGYLPAVEETLLVADLSRPLSWGPRAAGVEVRRVRDREELDRAGAVSRAAFGEEDGRGLEEYAARLADPGVALFLAYVDGVPAALGRLDTPADRSFASLWGGGTTPPYRHRGVYRELVRVRADEARARGYPFLYVEARDTSRPILERLGFRAMGSITEWLWRPTGTAGENPQGRPGAPPSPGAGPAAPL